MTNLPAGIALDILVFGAVNGDVSGFNWDQTNYPDLDPPETVLCSWFSWQMYIYHQDNVVPAWHRVYCGITLPNYSGSYSLAAAAATSVGLNPATLPNSAVAVCNAIRGHVGAPWDGP